MTSFTRISSPSASTWRSHSRRSPTFRESSAAPPSVGRSLNGVITSLGCLISYVGAFASSHGYCQQSWWLAKCARMPGQPYNTAADLIDRNLRHPERIAVVDESGQHTYAALAERVNRAGHALRALGVQEEQRVLLVSAALLEKLTPILRNQPFLREVVVSGGAPPAGTHAFTDLVARASAQLAPAQTTADDVAFWLYSSGSTGTPKGAMHLQGDLVKTAELYARDVLGIREDDVVFSAAKLFFAYGLGNAMTFPFSVGATAVLLSERPTPGGVMRVLREHQSTIFYAVPTLFAAILADPQNGRASGSQRLRFCVSAGEALPKEIGERWRERFGVDILDGIGSTEMLHIFLSLHPGDVRYGTTGKPVPGYQLSIVDEQDQPVPRGTIGELKVKGPTSAIGYWNNRAKSLTTFHGPWTLTGDKYLQDADGYYVYCGRSDDMLKVGGQWVSPAEVESALIGHPAVLEVAVVAAQDEHGLVKPKAFVVPKPGMTASLALVEELQRFVKDRLAPYKYPRWIEFTDALPKTATGKIQRF